MPESEPRLPWLQFYPDDWRKDEALRSCSLAARGLWAECLWLMHKATPYGHLLLNGHAPGVEKLAKHVAAAPSEVRRLLDELKTEGVYSTTDDGVIVCRRMVREAGRRRKERDRKRRYRGTDDGTDHGTNSGTDHGTGTGHSMGHSAGQEVVELMGQSAVVPGAVPGNVPSPSPSPPHTPPLPHPPEAQRLRGSDLQNSKRSEGRAPAVTRARADTGDRGLVPATRGASLMPPLPKNTLWPGRPPVADFVHADLRQRLGPHQTEQDLVAFYARTADAWADRPIAEDAPKFWRQRFAEWQGGTSPTSKRQALSAQNAATLATVLNRAKAGR